MKNRARRTDEITRKERNIVYKAAYLIGVPRRFFENEHSSPRMDVYRSMKQDKNARIVRNLCLLRQLTEYVPQDSIQHLSEEGIEIIKGNCKPIQYIIDLSNQIANRINNCRHLLPIWRKRDHPLR